MNKKIQDALNEQINAELYSSYLYLSMSAYFESINLQGFANWMRVQSQEEVTHALKIFDFINERASRVILARIEKPPVEWNSPLEVFQAAYKHEQKVTGMINRLVDMSIKEKDHALNNFLQWFVAEQVEEESSASDIAQKLELIGESGNGIFMMDRELGKRGTTE